MVKQKKRQHNKMISPLVLLIILAATGLAIYIGLNADRFFTHQEPFTERDKVKQVIDGDTIELNNGARVRISAVNAPEIGEEMGDEAKSFADRFLAEKQIVFVRDKKKPDHYGRMLGDILADGQSLRLAMVKEGYAHILIYPPDLPKNFDELLAAQLEARKEKRGIWALKRFTGPMHITTVHQASKGKATLIDEYVRLANVDSQAINLEGFILSNQKGLSFHFPNLDLPVGYSVLVVSGIGKNKLDPGRQLVLYWNLTQSVWERDDVARLKDKSGKMVDEVAIQFK
jgi:endonuclease YncB( thermonuclease family)